MFKPTATAQRLIQQHSRMPPSPSRLFHPRTVPTGNRHLSTISTTGRLLGATPAAAAGAAAPAAARLIRRPFSTEAPPKAPSSQPVSPISSTTTASATTSASTSAAQENGKTEGGEGKRLLATKPEGLNNQESHIWDLLARELSPTSLDVRDVSGGCGSMYAIDVTSARFRGLSLLRQQRLVNAALGDLVKQWHGLQLRTAAPAAASES